MHFQWNTREGKDVYGRTKGLQEVQREIRGAPLAFVGPGRAMAPALGTGRTLSIWRAQADFGAGCWYGAHA